MCSMNPGEVVAFIIFAPMIALVPLICIGFGAMIIRDIVNIWKRV